MEADAIVNANTDTVTAAALCGDSPPAASFRKRVIELAGAIPAKLSPPPPRPQACRRPRPDDYTSGGAQARRYL
jgi:hypothetical protein